MPKGGARPGAGRKKKLIKQLPAPNKCAATQVLGQLDMVEEYLKLLRWTDPEDPKVRILLARHPAVLVSLVKERGEIFERLNNRVHGRPSQAIEHKGAVTVDHTVPETTTPTENDERLADIFALAFKRAAQLPAGAGKERSARAAEAEG